MKTFYNMYKYLYQSWFDEIRTSNNNNFNNTNISKYEQNIRNFTLFIISKQIFNEVLLY